MSDITVRKSTAIVVVIITLLASSYITYLVVGNKTLECPQVTIPTEKKRSILEGQTVEPLNTKNGRRF